MCRCGSLPRRQIFDVGDLCIRYTSNDRGFTAEVAVNYTGGYRNPGGELGPKIAP
jgi:hypothetical protein